MLIRLIILLAMWISLLASHVKAQSLDLRSLGQHSNELETSTQQLTINELNSPPVELAAQAIDHTRFQQDLDALSDRMRAVESRIWGSEAQRGEQLQSDSAESLGVNEVGYVMNRLQPPSAKQTIPTPPPKKWYDKYSIRGYAQLRVNETLSLDPGSAPAAHNGDSSVGDNQSFLLRRARLIIFGDVTENIAIYFQPDFASSVPNSPDSNQFSQVRDWYADIHLDDRKIHRFRVGQSKIPYGWENLQSSQNRLPLDRNDALNSAAKNERDLGVFYYWTPQFAQDAFKVINDEGLKGSGNYGVFGVGFYNGQGGSFREQNDNLHFISRLTLPYTFDNGQIVEVGLQGYTGKYTVLSSLIAPLGIGAARRPLGTLETGNRQGIKDERLAGTIVYYPQPFGFQAEWTVGRGPGLNNAQTAVVEQSLYGGYAMAIYRHKSERYGEFWPFLRWTYYKGGYKSERNAPVSNIDEWELGVEWQINKSLELVTMYTMTDRTNTRAISTADSLSYRQFSGDLLRFQFQFNY